MFYAAFTDQDGRLHSNLYNNYRVYFADTFSPDTKKHCFINFRITGKTYADRKENARDLAIRFQSENLPGLSYGEIAEIQAFFEKAARRYGLIEEFRREAII